MKKLDVVNSMLATQGEDSLNSIDTPHPDLGNCLAALDRVHRQILGLGWQFNRESLWLEPSPHDSFIYLPTDYLEVVVHDSCGKADSNVTTRGNRLYNTDGDGYVFTKGRRVTLYRDVPFEDLPTVPAQAIHDAAVLWYQMTYDGDSTKTRQLERNSINSMAELTRREIRTEGANLLDNNPRLARLRSAYRRANSAQEWNIWSKQ